MKHSTDIDADTVAKNGYGFWLDQVKRFLDQVQSLNIEFEEVTKHAVQFQYKGIAVDLLVSPFWDRPRDFYQFLCSLSEKTRDE